MLFKEDTILPNILNNTEVRNMLHDNFDQVSAETMAYINCLLYAVLEHVVKKTKYSCDSTRVYPKHIQEAIINEDIIILNVGKINVNPEMSVDNIVQEVIRQLAVKGTKTVDYGKLLEGEDLTKLGEENGEQDT